ncbi:MAG: hypothetical protein ACPGU1_22155, partial [Myxococcota bacterium]
MMRALLATTLALVMSTAAHADVPDAPQPEVSPVVAEEVVAEETAEQEAPADDSADSPFSASVLAEVSIGAGTLTPGPAGRPYVNLLTRVRGSYRFEDLGLELGLSFSVNVNAV